MATGQTRHIFLSRAFRPVRLPDKYAALFGNSVTLVLRLKVMRPRIVIVGGGFGGLYAARSLKHAPVDVTLIDRRNFHLFQPLLYQVATGALSPGEIASPLRYVLNRQKNTRVLLAEVVDIDVDKREVMLTDHSRVPYDTVIFATGSTHSYFGHPEWAAFAPGLKTMEDATEIRTRVLLAFERAEKMTNDPAGPARESDFCHRGRWPHRRGTGRRHRRNLARHVEEGFPQHQSRRREYLL